MTPASAQTAWVTAADLLQWHHPRSVGDLVKPRAADPALSEGQILGSQVVARHIQAAIGQMEMAAIRGGKYTPANLAEMTGMAGQELRRIVSHLAFASLVRYRFVSIADEDLPGELEAKAYLKALAKGEVFLPFDEVAGAQQVDSQNKFRPGVRLSDQAGRFFGGSSWNRVGRG